MDKTAKTGEVETKTVVDRPWLFKKGQSGNPKGRPKGATSLKTFARDFIMALPEEDKIRFLNAVPPELVWRMSEGNPHSTSDETVKHIIPTPILAIDKVDKPVERVAPPADVPKLDAPSP